MKLAIIILIAILAKSCATRETVEQRELRLIREQIHEINKELDRRAKRGRK
jgi:hypothetical protein